MKLLRNKEIVTSLLIYIGVSAAAVAGALFIGGGAALFVLIVCLVFISVFLVTSYRRYQSLSRLAAELDRILHGNENIDLERFSEGELSILQSEIYKMTVTLKEQSQKLREDKIFLADSIADISHQIRTPLTSMNIMLSLLAEADIDQERRQELIRELYGLLSGIDRLINMLLKMSRLDAGAVQFKKETISLNELIRTAVKPLLVSLELKGQSFEAQTEGEFCGDAAWTCEAIGNIVKNCVEHTPEGGKITIAASENALYSEIIVSDNGNGIDKEDLPNIFKRFYKGKSSGADSFGIGLALAKMIVTGQNGTIKAENAAKGGAMFTVRFYKGVV
ncbi:MAG: HAMP domain-containing histidine kinase [Oscillospiraceae bacterium]|nr:HAMP domain-containing histidine kinase [Oscillospiraceae bacterium]